MIHINDEIIRSQLMHGCFGLEREALRVTEDGRFSRTPHPFPDDKHIVRDFCENQTEINTSVHDSVSGAVHELASIDRRLRKALNGLPEREMLWPFSNPPYIADENDIPVARFEGAQKAKTAYRDYLSGKYGRYKMTFCGVHFNFSFSDALIYREHELSGGSKADTKNRVYLELAEGLAEYGWLVTAITAASPLFDSSFFEKGKTGGTVFPGTASYRCGENGYWNDFVPVFDYGSLDGYAESVRRYIREGLLNSPSELYYPVRLKSEGVNDLGVLLEKGVDHIELRMIDLNPFLPWGVDERDIQFAHLLMLWLSGKSRSRLTEKDQVRTAANFKKAARFDLDTVSYVNRNGVPIPMRHAGLLVIEQMSVFFRDWPDSVREILSYEREKLLDKSKSLSHIVMKQYGIDFAGRAVLTARERQMNV